MKNLGTVQLSTNRILLRKIQEDDTSMVFKNYASDEEICKYLPWEAHKTIEDTNRLMSFYNSKVERDDFYWWGIVKKETNEMFGYVRVINSDEDNSTVEIEYCTGRGFWNHHYTTESLKRVLEFLFNDVGVKVICAKHHVDNAHSGRVMRRCGFVHVSDSLCRFKNGEGLYRNYELTKELFYDFIKNSDNK